MKPLTLEKLIELTKQVWEYGPVTLRILGSLLLAIGSFFENPWLKWPIVIIGGLIFAWGEYWNKVREKTLISQSNQLSEKEKRISELTEELGNYQYSLKNIAVIFVISIYERLNLNNCSRINLYLHDGQAFFLVARYSENQRFKNFSKRVVYPADQGCIAKAWELGEFLKNDLPDPENFPVDFAAALKNEFEIPESISANFSMKSRSLLGIRINNSQTKDNLAVIIIESTKVNQFDLQMIVQIKNFTVWNSMCSFLELNKNMLPKPSDASSKGF